ncbi:mucin-associated surface protein (MASP) [Trypanosoma cruzi]|nr:mucin-associated surface protein (MASP) [Trypanosoma cruzi]
MMMTGRVLLVCALCVLWCGAGGRCDEEVVEIPAGGGKVAVGSTGTSTPGSDSLDPTKGLPKVNQSTEKSEGKSLEGKEVKNDQLFVAPGVEGEDRSPSEQLEERLENAPEQGKTKPEIQNKEQEVGQPPKSQLNVLQQPQPQPQPQPPSAPQPHISSSQRVKVLARTVRVEKVSPHWVWKIVETRIHTTPEKKTY